MGVMLGMPGHWIEGELLTSCGWPAHVYPVPVNIFGQAPCHPNDAVRFACWCGGQECQGLYDQLGFPIRPEAWWNRRAAQ